MGWNWKTELFWRIFFRIYSSQARDLREEFHNSPWWPIFPILLWWRNEEKNQRIYWCFVRQLWGPGKSNLQRSSTSVKKKLLGVTNRRRGISSYKIHDQDPFQATYQFILLIIVMRKAFWSSIYKMLVIYEYMTRGLNRFYLLLVRLPFRKQSHFRFFIEIVFNFLYLFQKVVFEWIFV